MQSRGRKLHDDLLEVYGAMIIRVKARLDAGEHVPGCLAKTLIQTQKEENLDWEDMCMLVAVFTLGGVFSVRGFYFRCILMTGADERFRRLALSNGSSPSSRLGLIFNLALRRNLTVSSDAIDRRRRMTNRTFRSSGLSSRRPV